MLAARNLNYGGGSAKHNTGVHFSPVFSACIGQPMMNKTAECKTRVRQRAMWAKRGIITIQKEKKRKKKRNIARTFKHEDNFHYFLIPRSLAFGAADKREGCHVIFVIFIQWARCKWLQMLSYLILYIGCVFLFCAEWRYLNSRNKQEMNSSLS